MTQHVSYSDPSLRQRTSLDSKTSVFSASPDELLNKRECRDFVLEVIRYPAGKVIPMHNHAMSGLYVQCRGECRETWNRHEETLQPGTAVFRFADDPHSDVYSAPTQLVAIGIPEQKIGLLADIGISLSAPLTSRSASLLLLAQKLATSLASDDAADRLIAEGTALEIIGEMFHRQPGSRSASAVARAASILQDNFKQSTSLEFVATEVSMHPVHLAREFRRVHRMTMGEYKRSLKISYVCAKLKSSCISLTDLANEAGFADHSHLSRVFKAHTGKSPSEFRALSR